MNFYRNAKVTSVILSASALSACGSAYSAEVSSLNSRIKDLSGTWSMDCKADSFTSSHSATMSATANKLSVVETHHMFSSCGTAVVKVENDISYEIKEVTPDDLSVHKIDLVYNSVKMTPVASFVVSRFNKQKFCGFADWQLDVPKDVSGLKCDKDEIAAKGEKQFGILKIEDNQITFGEKSKKHDGKTESTRFEKLELKPFVRKN